MVLSLEGFEKETENPDFYMKVPSIFSIDIAFYNKIYFCAGLTLKQQIYKLGFNVHVLSPKLPGGSVCIFLILLIPKVRNAW